MGGGVSSARAVAAGLCPMRVREAQAHQGERAGPDPRALALAVGLDSPRGFASYRSETCLPEPQRHGRLAKGVAAPAGEPAARPHPAGVVLAGADRGEGPGGRCRLALAVLAPAGHGPVGLDPAGVVVAGADRGEGAGGRGRLAVGVVAPAGHGPVRLDPAGVLEAGADCGEGAGGRGRLAVVVVAPADHGAAVLLPPAGVGVPATDRRAAEQKPARRVGLAVGVAAPAGHGPAGLHAAGVEAAGADCGEGTRRRARRAGGVVAPAGHGPVGPHPAGVVDAGADRGEGARGRGRLAGAVVAPAGNGSARPHSAGVVGAGADRGEGAGGRGRLAGVVGAPAGNGPVRPNAAGVEVTGVDAGRDRLGPRGGDRGPGIAGRRDGGLGGGRRSEDGEGREEEGGAPVGVDARERTRKVVDDHQLTSESVGWAEAKLVATERSPTRRPSMGTERIYTRYALWRKRAAFAPRVSRPDDCLGAGAARGSEGRSRPREAASPWRRRALPLRTEPEKRDLLH